MAAALARMAVAPQIRWLRIEGLQQQRTFQLAEKSERLRFCAPLAASKRGKKQSEDAGLWEGGMSVPALQPREEESLAGFADSSGSNLAVRPKGKSGKVASLQEEVKLEGIQEVEEGNEMLLKRGAEGIRSEGGGVEVVATLCAEGTEDLEVEYDLEEDEEEDDWSAEIEDEDWDEDEEEEEYVEVWEGDLPPPTEEEEAELLREAEAEIAELEREQPGVEESCEKDLLPSSVVKLETELAAMRARVEEMEEELLLLKGSARRSGQNAEEVNEQTREFRDSTEDWESPGSGWKRNSGDGDVSILSHDAGGKSSNKGRSRHESYEPDGNCRESDVSQGDGGSSAVSLEDGLSCDGLDTRGAVAVGTYQVREFGEDEYLSDELLHRLEVPGAADDSPDKLKPLREAMLEFSHLKRKAKAQERAMEFLQRDDEEDDSDSENPKRRGLPAIMRCFDTAKIYVKAGDGGNGVVAFRREKYVPMGGPAGGSGGRGGDVYLVADKSLNSLLPFRKNVHFRAGRGSHGQGSSCHGFTGKDVEVLVPPGTVVRQVIGDEDGPVLVELVTPGQKELLLPGGRGGRGNAAFKTGRNRAPQLAENGEEGTEMWLKLELKLVADVGIVGVPNAGKSTLLSVISAAKPKVADYPFTTLVPNLGMAEVDFETLVVADVPGLLEGAHLGFGLGHEFLRHTERCRVLIHLVDGTRPQPEHDFEAICNELELFNPGLASKPQVVVYNKMDVPEASIEWPAFEATMAQRGIKVMPLSAATGEGSLAVLRAARDLLKSLPSEDIMDVMEDRVPVGEQLRAQRRAALENFSIVVDRHQRTFEVDGEGMRNFVQMTNWEYYEAVKRFQHVLEASGVNRALKEEGVRDGDSVVIGKMQFDWRGDKDIESLGEWKRGNRGSKVWPH